MKIKIKFVNSFHNNECNIIVNTDRNGRAILSTSQAAKIRNLCPGDCRCGRTTVYDSERFEYTSGWTLADHSIFDHDPDFNGPVASW
jgi:hypothetical protein